jgi:hypothetical protein
MTAKNVHLKIHNILRINKYISPLLCAKPQRSSLLSLEVRIQEILVQYRPKFFAVDHSNWAVRVASFDPF